MKLKFNIKKPKQLQREELNYVQTKIQEIETAQNPKSKEIKKSKRIVNTYIAKQNLKLMIHSLLILLISFIPTIITLNYRNMLLYQIYLSNDINAKKLWLAQQELNLANIIVAIAILCGLLFTYARVSKKKWTTLEKIKK